MFKLLSWGLFRVNSKNWCNILNSLTFLEHIRSWKLQVNTRLFVIWMGTVPELDFFCSQRNFLPQFNRIIHTAPIIRPKILVLLDFGIVGTFWDFVLIDLWNVSTLWSHVYFWYGSYCVQICCCKATVCDAVLNLKPQNYVEGWIKGMMLKILNFWPYESLKAMTLVRRSNFWTFWLSVDPDPHL